MASLRHQIANLVSVPLTMVKLSIMKVFYPKSLRFVGIERFSPNVVVDTDRRSRLYFGKRISIHSGSRISVNSGGNLRINDNTSFNVGCILTCKYKVDIGSNVSVGPNVMIFDHDHAVRAGERAKNLFDFDEIVIGDNTWIGAGVIILAGTHIGKNCVIAAGSVVKGIVSDNTVLIQKREKMLKHV